MNADELMQRLYVARGAMYAERVDLDGYVVRINPDDWAEIRMSASLPYGWDADRTNTVMGMPFVVSSDVQPGQIILRREVLA